MAFYTKYKLLQRMKQTQTSQGDNKKQFSEANINQLVPVILSSVNE